MKTINPFFTVVVPTYNQDEYLGPALDSLLAQEFKDWEAVIVNDGSTDNTSDVMEKYATRDDRFRCYHKENGGVATALNVGIENARGQWICWLSSDDLFEPDKLKLHFEAIKKYPHIKFFHSHWYLLFEKSQQKIAPGLWLAIPQKKFQVLHFFIANYVHGNAIAVHKSVFKEVGLFDPELRQGQDFDMWLRISAKFESFFIPKRTCVTRIHEGQTTNSFTEGGVLESTRSLFNFLKSKSFEALFPFSNLKDPVEIADIFNEILKILETESIFLYRCGYSTVLLEKSILWLNNGIDKNIKQIVLKNIASLLENYFRKTKGLNPNQDFRHLLKPSKYIPVNDNIYNVTLRNIKKETKIGNQDKVLDLERFLVNISKFEKDEENYNPVFLNYYSDTKSKKLVYSSTLKWVVRPVSMQSFAIGHNLDIHCPSCSKYFVFYKELELLNEAQTMKFICPNCKESYHLSDTDFSGYLLYRNNQLEDMPDIEGDNRLAFYMRGTNIVGGGINIVFKHIEWLDKLGVDISVYSYSSAPDWVKLPGRFKKIKTVNDIELSKFGKIVVFSVFDLPGLMQKVKASRIIHICQGYEGYHFGRNSDEMRADKYIFTLLHSLPTHTIAVSDHLMDLFKEKFNKTPVYIPNSINHNVFFPLNKTKTKNHLLFIGNPFHPLKGFELLIKSVHQIQNSEYKISNLKLTIVAGIESVTEERIANYISADIKCDIKVKVKLTPTEIAQLINEADILVGTSWYEGFSLPILEAMACGTPVITTNNMGAESFCKDGYNSFIIQQNDFTKLSTRILEILNRTIDLTMIIQNAISTSKEYNSLSMLNKLIKGYQSLLKTEFLAEKKENLLKKVSESIPIKVDLEEKIINEDEKLDISIVIPTFNKWEYTKQCIDSINEFTHLKHDIIISDNLSEDQTRTEIRNYRNVNLILNKKNYGFPKGVNIGLLEAEGKYVLISNNDVIIPQGTLARMVEAAESDPKIGIVGPISNSVSGGQIDRSADYKTIKQMHSHAKQIAKINKGKIVEFPRIVFLCTLIKKELIEKIGGLDERFSPGNYEDDDYCLRAQMAGYKTVIATDAFVHHFGSISFGAQGAKAYDERIAKNKKIFVDKWGGDPEDIWLKGIQPKNRHIVFPIDKNSFVQHFTRANVCIESEEYEMAIDDLNICLDIIDNGSSEPELLNHREKIVSLISQLKTALKN